MAALDVSGVLPKIKRTQEAREDALQPIQFLLQY